MRQSHKVVFALFSLSSMLLTGCNPAASATTPEVIKTYTLSGDAVFPEGVAYRSSTKNFFVTSFTDGSIFRGSLKTPNTETFLPAGSDGRTSTVGLKVDEAGQLFIAAGTTGKMFVYNADTKALIKTYTTPATAATLINDVTLTADFAYFTDSYRPVLFRIPKTASAGNQAEAWLDLTNSPVVKYQAGFNLNGIAATGDGQYLLTVQSNTGKLFRIGVTDKAVTEVKLDAPITNGDGLLLDGQTLYVVRNFDKIIVPVTLAPDFASGALGTPFSDTSFRFPTTVAQVNGRLLVVNSQLDRLITGQKPVGNFTVSNIEIPQP